MSKYQLKKNTGRKAHGLKLDCQTITTTDPFKTQPIFARNVYPHDFFNVNLTQFNRVDALPVSSFCSLKNRAAAFYVKWQQLWKPFDAFLNKSPYAYGGSNIIPTSMPYVTAFDLFSLLITNVDRQLYCTLTDLTNDVQDGSDIIRYVEDTKQYDFIYVWDNNGLPFIRGYKLTSLGRHVYSVLNLLGYRIPSIDIVSTITIGDTTLTANRAKYQSLKMNALPLMAYCSILVNYFTPQDLKNYAFVNSFSYERNPIPQHSTTAVPPAILAGWFDACASIIAVTYYGDDYFTRLKRELFKGDGKQYQDLFGGVNDTSISDPSTQNIAPFLEIDTNAPSNSIDKYLIQVMSSLTDQSQLTAMSQNDIVSQAITKFGYKPEIADMKPLLLETTNARIYISPEVAQADTAQYDFHTKKLLSGAPVGYKAGSGEGSLKLSYKGNFTHYGTLMVISSVSPDYFYYKGLNRELQSIDHELIFNEMLANVGAQACAISEYNIDAQNPDSFDGTLGFSSKYAELCQPISQLGGDFIVNTRSMGMDSFHYGRVTHSRNEHVSTPYLQQIQSARIVGADQYSVADGNQYDRIFVDNSAANDHIQQWNMFDVTANRNCAPYGDFTIGDENGASVDDDNIGVMNN